MYNLREFAIEMSETSLGSSQTLRCPQPSTEAASRFCNFRLTIVTCFRLYYYKEKRGWKRGEGVACPQRSR